MPRLRLQRFLAESGLGSRRACERLIAEGRVAVNGVVVTRPGVEVDSEGDRVTVDGRRVRPQKKVHLLFYKPRGVVCTITDDDDSIARFFRAFAQRLYPAGRLDRDSEGLIILTNDGELAGRLTHPRYGVEKEYHVFVKPRAATAVLAEAERKGAWSSDGRLAVERLRLLRHKGDGSWISAVCVSGRKRLVRRLLAKYGLKVKRLIRVRIGPVAEDGALAPGRWRRLRRAELARLRRETGLDD